MFIGLGLSLTRLRGGAADAYAIAGFSPKLVLAPKADVYRTGGNAITFAGMVDYTGASNKTMTDSTGALKWAPHNLLTWSEDFTNAAWSDINITKTSTSISIDSNAANVIFQTVGYSALANTNYTHEIEAKASVGQWVVLEVWGGSSQFGTRCWFDLVNGVQGTLNATTGFNAISASIRDAGDGYYTLKVTGSRDAAGTYFFGLRVVDGDGAYNFTGVSGNVIDIRKAAAYRSDLGGMADNPDTGNSYVPTTSAARYLSRRNHHVYEGGEWVNAGMLVEPTAATNLLLNSATLSTQNVTVTAVPTTLHFTGTGTVTLSGASTAGPLVGTGTGENNRVRLTFTPSAGTLTLTVSGTVTNAQLEAGSVPSSYIPTAGSTATRAAETVSIAAAKLPFVNPDNLGPELVTNGTFDTDTDWAKVNATIGSGQLTMQANGYATQNIISASAGVWYEITITVASTAGAAIVYCGTPSSGDSRYARQFIAGTYTFLLQSAGVSNQFRIGSNAAGISVVDNISVREVTALELSIAMRGRMTYADNDITSEAIFARWFLDGSNEIKTELWTNATNVGAAYFTQRQAGTVDRIGQVVPGSYSPGINVPFSIASRHGSTFINGAVDGVALTADLTPTSLPNLSATNLSLAQSGGPMIIEEFAMWDVDLADAGIEEASE